MKKQQIPFDFSKWGQDGISAKLINGVKILTMHVHPIEMDVYYGVSETDNYCIHSQYIQMYQEIKPREIWVNEFNYGLSDCNWFSHTKESALEAKAIVGYKRTIKFREVLDDEQ